MCLQDAGLFSTVGSESEYRCKGHEFEPLPSHITSFEIDHEMISMILPLPLIQEGQFSVTVNVSALSTTGYPLRRSISLPRNSMSR